jgi:uncharacterized protein YoxC
MGPGGIATIIAAASLAVIALAVAYAIVRVGRLVDEASASLKVLTEETTPLLHEVTNTVELVNAPLTTIASVSKNIGDVSSKIANATESFVDKNGLAMKVAASLLGVAQEKKSRRQASEEKPRRRRTKTTNEDAE